MRIPLLLAASALVLAACMPIQPAPAGGTVPAPTDRVQPPAVIRFDDGSECVWAGDGATLAFDGQRVNYTCTREGADAGVILGPLAPADLDSTFVTLTRGTLGRTDAGFTLEDAASATYMVARVLLLDPSGEAQMECLNAGQGATFGFNEVGRANFTCGDFDDGPFGALFGPLVHNDLGEWNATFGMVSRTSDGFSLDSSAVLRVTALGLEPGEPR